MPLLSTIGAGSKKGFNIGSSLKRVLLDFESGIGTWVSNLMTATWSANYAKFGTYSVRFTPTSANCNSRYTFATPLVPKVGTEASFYFYIASGPASDDCNIDFYCNNLTTTFGIDFQRETTSFAYTYGGPVTLTIGGSGSTGITLAAGTWYKYEVIFNGTTSTMKIINANGTTAHSRTIDLSSITSINAVDFNCGNVTTWSVYADNILVDNYA